MNRQLSLVLSIAALMVIAVIWYQSERYQPVVNAKPDDYTCSLKRDCARIPTGLYIQSVHFLDSSDVNVSGYLWQKYPHSYDLDPDRAGVIFPEEVNSSDALLSEAYRDQTNPGYTLVGWYFDVTLRQHFDYGKYPLDSQEVWLRLWPRDITNIERILLVPDKQSYSLLDGDWPQKFGLDPEIVPGGWRINQTFFDYHEVRYGTNFGFADERTELNVTELQFNVAVTRNFRNAFVINLVPLLVVALLLFAQLALNTRDDAKADRFGANVAGTIATGSALFFVVVLAHIQVRSQFAGSDIVYIEFFYLIMYVFIFLVVLDSYVFASGQPKLLAQLVGRDNAVARITYWPTLLWAFAFATVFVFVF